MRPILVYVCVFFSSIFVCVYWIASGRDIRLFFLLCTVWLIGYADVIEDGYGDEFINVNVRDWKGVMVLFAYVKS